MPDSRVDPPLSEALALSDVSAPDAVDVPGAMLPFVWSSASSVLTLLAGVAASFLSARYLGPAGFGIFGLVQWTRITAAMLLDIGMSSAMTKFTAELTAVGRVAEASRFERAVTWLQVTIAAAGALGMIVLAPLIASLLGQAALTRYLPIASATLALTLVNGVIAARLVGERRFGFKALVDTCVSLAWLGGVVAVVTMDLGIQTLVIAEALVAGAQFAALCWLSRHVLTSLPIFRFPESLVKRVWRYAMGVFLLTTFDAILWQRSEVLFLSIFRGADDVGYFTIAYGLSVTLITLLPHSLGVVIFPSLSERFGANDRSGLAKLYDDSTRHIALIALPLCVGGMVIAPQLIRLLYGDAFYPAGGALRVLFVGATIGALATPGSSLLLAVDKAGTRSLFAIPMIVLNAILAIVLIPAFGVLGAAVAKSTTQAIHVATDVVYLAVREGFWADPVALGRIVAASAAPGVVAFGVVQYFPGLIGVSVAILLGAIAYLAALVRLKAIPEEDLRQISKVFGKPGLATMLR